MNRLLMKKHLRKMAKPVKQELFEEVGFTKEEYALMKYLYLDKIEQWWVADEVGVSISTLSLWHRDCINQLISYFNFQKYKFEHEEKNDYEKYFKGINIF